MRFQFKTSYNQDIRLFRDKVAASWYGLLAVAALALPVMLSEYYVGETTWVFIYAIGGISLVMEQRFPGLFDNWQAFVSFVVDDIDCDPGDMLRSCTGSRKCTAKIAKHLACLRCKITIANKHAIYVFGLLARNENQLASSRNNDLGVRLGSR